MARTDTIVALATPPGKGAISVIRLSGAESRLLLESRLRSRLQVELLERTPVLGRLIDPSGHSIDQVLATVFPAPHSYTGEDVVEISCHGSPPVARRIVEMFLELGARLAEPGEFTMRAFLNGKMDLAQAEAVRDLIESQTAFQAKVAAEQLDGKLSRLLQPIKAELLRVISHMETTLEFVEDQVSPEARESLGRSLDQLDHELGELEATFELGKIVHDGLVVSIAGRPNAGKSSLFNALLLEDRAIVTEIPGTTRDALTEAINLQGIPVRLVDTAGIREASELVEALGVQKSLDYLRQSDVVLFVVDRNAEFAEDDLRVWASIRHAPCILVLNKEDLPARVEIPSEITESVAARVELSALRRLHLDELKEAIVQVAAPEGRIEREGVVLTNARHKQCIELARRYLQSGLQSYESGLSEEFPLYDFRKTLDALGQITGETTIEDILQQIFSTFCIGK